MDVFSTYIKHNHDLLEGVGLLNRILINTSGAGVRETTKWVQPSKDLFGCEEIYKECDYCVEGESKESIVKVFVAEACGEPPAQFSTSGYEQEGGVLHFGFLFKDDDEDVKAIFFVIHPSS